MQPEMKHFKTAVCVISVALALLVGNIRAQQVPLPRTAAEVPGPASGSAMTWKPCASG